MQRKDRISGNLAEKQEIVFMLASGRQTVPGQAKNLPGKHSSLKMF